MTKKKIVIIVYCLFFLEDATYTLFGSWNKIKEKQPMHSCSRKIEAKSTKGKVENKNEMILLAI